MEHWQNEPVKKDRIKGIVRRRDDGEGWGVIDAAETPGGCFVLFSDIVGVRYRNLRAGERVTLTFDCPGFRQDGYDYVERQVWQEEGV
jgi:CspA family cold shock protein